MDRLPLSANKSNLLRLREELSFAIDGMTLLDEKKEALLSHIRSLSTRSDRMRTKVNQALQDTYRRHRETLLMVGRLACERAAMAARADEDVDVIEKSFMGVALPVLRISIPPPRPTYGFLETGFSMDETVSSVHRSLEIIAELAEVEVGLFRLITEIKKTLKRINALENIYIPLYHATIKHIEETLEEKEREFLFQLKRQKGRREDAEHGSL
ncbi:MAG: V-type ATP synthase subunit D [Desulfatirhabdiaceae bacterium]